VTGIASGAGADGAIGIRLADTVTLLAAAGHCGTAFQLNEGMGRAASASGLVGLGEIHLVRRKAFLAVDCRPSRSGMRTAEELLIDGFMATPAVAGGELFTRRRSPRRGRSTEKAWNIPQRKARRQSLSPTWYRKVHCNSPTPSETRDAQNRETPAWHERRGPKKANWFCSSVKKWHRES
jgi:hypothetical protein